MTTWTWKCTHVHVYKTDIAFEKFNKIKGKNSILTHNLHSSLKNLQYCLFLLRCCLLYSLSIKYCKYIVGITIRLYQFFCDFFFYQSVGCVCLMFAKLNFQTKLTIKYECLSYIFLKPQFYFIKTLKHTCKFHVTNILEHKLNRIDPQALVKFALISLILSPRFDCRVFNSSKFPVMLTKSS